MEWPISSRLVPWGTCFRRKASLCSICPSSPKTSLSVTEASLKEKQGKKRIKLSHQTQCTLSHGGQDRCQYFHHDLELVNAANNIIRQSCLVWSIVELRSQLNVNCKGSRRHFKFLSAPYTKFSFIILILFFIISLERSKITLYWIITVTGDPDNAWQALILISSYRCWIHRYEPEKGQELERQWTVQKQKNDRRTEEAGLR